MSLTVPTAGTTGGRAAEVRYEVPETGNVIAAFGERVKQLGDRLEGERLDVEMGRAQIDMTRDLNQLRLKYEQMGDPAAIEKGWAADVAALKGSYQVDPKIRDRWELGFDDLADRHAFALGQNVVAIRRSQSAANQIEYGAVMAQSAASSDPGTRATLYAQNDERLDAMVARGEKTPEEAAAEKLAARQNGDFDALTYDLGRDPEAVREGLANGAYANLTPDQRARGEAALGAADEKARVQAEKQTADTLAGLKTSLTEGIKLVKDGKLSTAEALLDNPAVRPLIEAEFPELVGAMRGAIGLRKNKVYLGRMTRAQLEATAKQWSGSSFSADYQADGLRAIEARLAEVKAAERTDPVALWKGSDMGLSEIDLSTPETMRAGLQQRAVDVGRLAKSGHLTGQLFLDKEEAAAIRDLASVNRAPAARLQLAMDLQDSLGADGGDVVLQLTGDEVLAGVASMMGSGAGNSVLARQILAGQRIAAENGLPLPSEGAWREIINAQFGDLFADGTVDGQGDENSDLRMLGAMAFGLYVQRKGAAADLSADALDATALEQAFHEVAGGTGTFNSRGILLAGDATGGIQTVNGHKTILPPGMTAAEIENGLADLSTFGLFGRADPLKTDDVWRSISASGNVPRLQGEPIDKATFDDLALRPASDEAGYNLVWFNPGTQQMEALQGDDGRAFLLDVDKVINFDLGSIWRPEGGGP